MQVCKWKAGQTVLPTEVARVVGGVRDVGKKCTVRVVRGTLEVFVARITSTSMFAWIALHRL